MIPIDQTRTDGPGGGNCLAACVASILELDIADCDRDFQLSQKGVWWGALQRLLNAHGYHPFSYVPDGVHFPQIAPAGYHIACSATHATVAYDGVVIHDPHPRKRGLAEIAEWILLIPLASHVPTRYTSRRDERIEAESIAFEYRRRQLASFVVDVQAHGLELLEVVP